MKLLLDTHPLLWAAGTPIRLSAEARALISPPDNELFFSVASIWKITIKHGLGRDDFRVEARVLRRGLLDNGYSELACSEDILNALSKLRVARVSTPEQVESPPHPPRKSAATSPRKARRRRA